MEDESSMSLHAQPHAAFPAEGSLRGSDSPAGGHGKGQHQKSPKAKVLKQLYDVEDTLSERGERGELLKKIAGGRSKPHHPADDDVAEWMRQVRKRAEERAEKRWRKKFEVWQQTEGRSAGRRPKAHSDVPSSWPDQGGEEQEETLGEQELRQKLEASEQRCEQMREANERMGRELQMEQERSDALERQLRQACGERDAWRGRAARHGDRLQKSAAERRHAASKVADLGRLLQELTSRAPRDVQLPSSADLVESGADPAHECSEERRAQAAEKPMSRTTSLTRQEQGPMGEGARTTSSRQEESADADLLRDLIPQRPELRPLHSLHEVPSMEAVAENEPDDTNAAQGTHEGPRHIEQ